MSRTVEATITSEGKVELKESVRFPSGRRALVTILGDGLSTEMPPSQRPRNGKELVAYWRREGLIGTRPETVDSQELARRLRRQAEHRR